MGFPEGGAARGRDPDPRPRGKLDRLKMAGDPAVLGPQVHVYVRLSWGEDAAMRA